jgi:transposase
LRGRSASAKRRIDNGGEIEVVLPGGARLTLRGRVEAIRYGLGRWDGLVRFLDDGRIEIDSNTVERTIRPIALNRKNALFAGSDGGGEHWAILASLIETAKLNGIDPQAYLAGVLARIAKGHPVNCLDRLLPWIWINERYRNPILKSPITKMDGFA